MNLSSYWIRFKSFINESIRVLRITRKPSREEFKTIVKVSGLGMIIIGLIGFIITMVKQLLFP
ncbi:MAG: protein translocase SEC61 complex subunit gamma [Nanoarchaeota archaeon]|nr:protein translocase SEC61 complex subunit gamma [Nanoarchaeota archaeon]